MSVLAVLSSLWCDVAMPGCEDVRSNTADKIPNIIKCCCYKNKINSRNCLARISTTPAMYRVAGARAGREAKIKTAFKNERKN